MTHSFADITFTNGVKAAQEHYGSRPQNERLQNAGGPNNVLTEREAEFIAQRDSFYMATVNEDGWPYVQHRGGPTGFLKVISEAELAFADYRGNRQLISVGNAAHTSRCSLFLMDYANRRRLKILGHLRFEDDDSSSVAIAAKEVLAGYAAKVERIVSFDVVAFDWNCPQHITPRYSEEELKAYANQAGYQPNETEQTL